MCNKNEEKSFKNTKILFLEKAALIHDNRNEGS